MSDKYVGFSPQTNKLPQQDPIPLSVVERTDDGRIKAAQATEDNDVSTLVDNKNMLSNYGLGRKTAAVAFIFDDLWDSQLPLATEFENRGCGFGLAANNQLGDTNKIMTTEALDLESRGFEFMLHGATHLDMGSDQSVTYAQAVTEIESNNTYLTGAGLTPKGFVAPFSDLDREFYSIVRKFSDHSYTVYNNDPQTTDVPVSLHGMTRVSLFAHTTQILKDLVDEALSNGELITFYDHDPSQVYNANSASQAKILEILDYVISQGIPVILPSVISEYFQTKPTGKETYVRVAEGQSIPETTFTTILPETDIDTDILFYDSVTGEFKIRETGVYHIFSAMRLDSKTTQDGTRTITSLTIDGANAVHRSEGVFVSNLEEPTAQRTGVSILSQSLSLTKGQVVSLEFWQNGVTNTIVNSGLYSYIQINKVA